MTIKINDLSNEIVKNLANYSKKIEQELEVAKDEISKEAVAELKRTSPKKTGEYAKGWVRKKVGKTYVIHNKKYQLTHLLEHGHAKRGGGRVAARVHIRPVEEKVIKDFTERVEKAVKS